MRTIPIVKLLIVFAVAFSLASLTGPMSSNFHLPTIQPARALPAPCDVTLGTSCSEFWVPAGPAEDTLVNTIFTDEQTEFTNIQSASPSIDLTDWPLTPDLTSPFTTSSNFRITSTISAAGNFENEFMLDANFWGVNFNFGNDPNGVHIRQGIAHMIDNAKFAANEPSLSGQAVALDTPNPSDNVGSLPTANPCAWDSLFPQTGSNCIVGAPGGTAYHLGPAAGANGISWLQAPGSADLNAAAQHFVTAGVATGFNSATSVLTGISAAAGAHTVNYFIRNDNVPRLHLGDSVAEQICYLFTGSYNIPCTPYLSVTHGPITAFPGFTTSTTSVNISWQMYTAAFGSVTGPLPFDSTYYFIYNSQFVSGIPSIQPPCSSKAVPTVSAPNYMYQCDPAYDSLTNQMEFAPCLTATGDAAVNQQVTNLATCPGTAPASFAVTSGSTAVLGRPGSTTLPTSVTGLNGFTGTVNLAATISPASNAPTISLSSATQTVGAGTPVDGGPGPTLTISTTAATGLGGYTVTVTGTSGSLSSSATIPVTVGGATLSLPSGSGFGYTLPGGTVDPGYSNVATGTTVYAPQIGSSLITKASAQCNPGGAASASCTVTGNPNKIGVSITVSPTATPGPIPSTMVYCQTAPCVITWTGGTFTMSTSNSLLLVAGVSSAAGGLSWLDPTYVAAAGTATAISAGVLAADQFGRNAYTIEVFQQNEQFGYLNNGWRRAINNVGSGLPNFFTWLNAWNPSPALSGTIRQGFKQTTSSVSPFIDSTVWDAYIVGSIYDSLVVANPLSGGQLVDWMALSVQQLSNSSLTYTPPQKTVQTFRFTLRSDMFFQDGRKVTSFDVAFSYLALKAVGAFASGGAAPMTGITILGPSQFDINVNAVGPFTLLTLSGLPIMPGAYWTGAGSSAWSSGISACTATGAACYPAQYTLVGTGTPTAACAFNCASFPATLMNVNLAQTSAGYDPIVNHTLVGSSGYTCGVVTSSGSSTSCSSTGAMNPPVGGSYVLSRFGKGLAPASSVSGIYFRSNGNLAAYLWSQDTGDITHDFLNFSVVASCFGAAVTSTGPCAHFQRGIGANGGPISVGLSQVAIVNRFVGLNWVAPFNWAASPPVGIIPLTPVLYENTITLNPASLVGCATPYPTGGYDC